MSTSIFMFFKSCGRVEGMSRKGMSAPIIQDTSTPGNADTKGQHTKAKMPKLRLRDQMFVTQYLRNGHNATQAYLATKSKSKNILTAMTGASQTIRNPLVREAINNAMFGAGIDEHTVSHRISQQLRHEDPWISNEGIKHSIKILGLAAPAESHLTVDKRSVSITLSAEDSKALLKDLMKKSK